MSTDPTNLEPEVFVLSGGKLFCRIWLMVTCNSECQASLTWQKAFYLLEGFAQTYCYYEQNINKAAASFKPVSLIRLEE